MAQPVPSANVEAHIQGEVSGQVAAGNHNIQIGSIHGGVVNVTPLEQQPRPTPVLLRPPRFPGPLLNREAEVGAAIAALRSGQSVEFYGPRGIGKTTLLRHLAYHPVATSFPDGIVYLSARGQSMIDLLQSLFEAFYKGDAPWRPTDVQIRHALQDKHALVLLDDVELARDEVEALIEAVPGCSFVLASRERRLWREGHSLALHGLPLDDALMLVEQKLGRPLTLEERPSAQALCIALTGHPLHLLQAISLVRDDGHLLAEIARQMQEDVSDEALTPHIPRPFSESGQHSGQAESVRNAGAAAPLASGQTFQRERRRARVARAGYGYPARHH